MAKPEKKSAAQFSINRSGFRALSSVCVNFSAVSLASLVLQILIDQEHIVNWPIVIFGIISTAAFLVLSILSAQKGKL